MVVISSLGPTGKVTITVNRKMLGLKGEARAFNAETGEQLAQPSTGSFALDIPQHDFRLIVIEPAGAARR